MIEIVNRFESHLEVMQDGLLASDLLAQETGLSKQRIKQIMQQGAVWLTDGKSTRRLRRAKKTLTIGQTLHLYYDKAVLEQVPPEAKLVLDLDAYSVWNKPCGMLSQGSKWGDHCTIMRWAERNLMPERSSFVVHRLDRATNGLIMLAHQKKVAIALSELFHDRKIEKRYCATVAGKFELPQNEVILRCEMTIDGRHAVSVFRVITYDEALNQTYLDVAIETGRKHQIRRHLASLGHPIIGDRLYGSADEKSVDLQLCATYLAFDCPVTHQPQQFELEPLF